MSSLHGYTVNRASFFSAKTILENFFWPSDHLALPDHPVLDNCGVIDAVPMEDDISSYNVTFAIVGELGIFLEEVGVEVVFFSGNTGFSTFEFRLDTADQVKVHLNTAFEIRFHPKILFPVEAGDLDISSNWSRISFESQISIDINGAFSFEPMGVTNLTKSFIGETGIAIEATGVEIAIWNNPSFVGLKRVSVTLPTEIQGAPEVVIEDAFIDSRGFSGNVSTEWALVLTPDGKDFDSGSKVGTLFSEDIKFAFRQIQLSLENNIPTGFRIIGALKLPSFDNVVEAELSLTESGEILVAMRGIGGDLITFSKENLFILDVKAFEIFRSDQELALTLNCDLKLTHPTVKDLIPKLGLEKFTVHKLDGKKWSFRVEGGTVEIQKSVDLFGVARCDINEIGISERGGQDHLTFSGGVQLLEGVDAGAWVEGLRVPLGSGGGLALDGIGLRVVVPKSFEFEGSAVRKQENGISYFEGLMNLKLLPIQMGMGAYLKVGKNSNCRFAYLAAKLELPEPGIPLASLPLYLRSIEGLIGINSTPDAEKIQDYFSLSNREPIGLTHGSKWRDQCGSHAIGFGVGIATANSRLLHISSLLAFLYPELVLLIEGKAFVLQKPNPKKTPPFHALLAFDSDEPSALINISVQQEFIQGVMEASGMVEAYFSPDTWHLALGQAKPYFPVDRPIGAKVLKLFSANSYLILTPKTWELGSSIGLKEKYGFKRASVHFKASMKGVGQLNWGPEQVKGYLDLQGSVGFRIWKIGFDLSLRASVLGMAPDWLVEAILEFFIKIRLVFKKRKFGGKIPFRWERRVTPPLSPVLKEIVLQHRVSEKSWRPYLLHSFESHSCATVPPLASIPVVEPDTLPTLTFHYPINDRTGNTFGQEIRETELRHQSGDYEFVAELPEEENGHRGIELFRLPINQWGTDNWERFRATTNDVNSNGEIGEPSPILYGAWQADKAPDGTEGATHLHLFAQTPFEYNQPVRLSVIHRGSYLNKVGSLDSCDPIRVDEPSVLNNDSASTIEIPSFNWELKDPDDLRKTARAFPSRPVQYVFKEDHQYPWNAVVEKKEECINFLTTRSGWYHGNELVQVGAESIPVPDFGVHQQPSEDVLLWGFSLYYPPHVPVEEVEEGRLPIPHGICNVTTDQSFPSLKYLSFPYHKIYGSDGSVYNLTPNNRPKFREGVPGLFLCMILLKNLVERLTINYSGRFISFLQPSDEIPFQNFPAIQFASAFQADFPGQNVWPTNKDITIQPSPTVDNSEDGKLVISALSSAQAFNKVLVSIIAPAKIYSLCYVVDSYNKIKEKENQLDNYACTIWPKTPGTNIPSGPMSKNAPAMETQTDELGLGYVYRLEVTTKQARKNRHGATRNDSYCAFFQVSRPPSSLASYVLTSYPKATGFPHYRTHEIFIRFHKSYIHNLLGKQDHEFSWKLLLRGRTLSILPFRDGEDADLERFQENLDPARNGWGWGKSTTHKLTDEEKVWMAAFNRQSSVHISESWANPDDMIWI